MTRAPGRSRVALVAALVAALSGLASEARAQGLDWEVEEAEAGPVVTSLRNGRDGVIGLFEDALDLQLGLFAEVALLGGTLTMGLSDAVGLVDDNPLTQYVFKGIASRSLAKTAYLLHVSGSEAILGGHGLEAEWALEDAMSGLNPLLADEAPPRRLPLDPLCFVEDGMLHVAVYRAHVPGRIAVSSLVADALVRPAGNLLRIASRTDLADRVEAVGTGLVREVVSE